MSKATPEVFYKPCEMSELAHVVRMLSPALDRNHGLSLKRFVGEVQLIEMTINYFIHKVI